MYIMYIIVFLTCYQVSLPITNRASVYIYIYWILIDHQGQAGSEWVVFQYQDPTIQEDNSNIIYISSITIRHGYHFHEMLSGELCVHSQSTITPRVKCIWDFTLFQRQYPTIQGEK